MKKDDVLNILTAMKKSYLSLGIPDPEAVGALDIAIQAICADNSEDMAIQYAEGYKDGFIEGAERNRPKSGHWEKTTDDYCYWYKCSCCGTKVPKNEWGSDYFSPYCPECGAKMIEPQESEKI